MACKILVIDGVDGTGKNTQCKLVKQFLDKVNIKNMMVDFPDYGNNSSALVKMYLNGEILNKSTDVNPYAAACAYALDRYIKYVREIKGWMEENEDGVVILDRYISANIIHQGAKIRNEKERLRFFDWCNNLEIGLFGLPEPSETFLLTVEPTVSKKMRDARGNVKDGHERDEQYMEECYYTAIQAADYLNWEKIECDSGGNIDSIEVIQEKLLDKVMKTLGR